LTNFKQFW